MSKIKQIFLEKPLIGAIFVAILFNVFLFLALITLSLIYIFMGEMTFYTIIWLQFCLTFGFLTLLLMVIIPYGLDLPNEVYSLSEFFEAIQLKTESSVKHNIILGLIVAAVFIMFEIIAGLILIEITFDLTNLFTVPQPNNLGIFLWIYNLRPGILEEVAFRGIILTVLLKKYSKRTAILIDGIIFGLVHFMNFLLGADLLATLIQIIYATILGFLLAFMYIKTKSIISCILTHYFIDVFGQVFIISSINLLTYLIVIVGFAICIPVLINSYIIKLYTQKFF